jgi:hypothetical protein
VLFHCSCLCMVLGLVLYWILFVYETKVHNFLVSAGTRTFPWKHSIKISAQ